MIMTKEGHDHYIQQQLESKPIVNFLKKEDNLLVICFSGAKKTHHKRTDLENTINLHLSGKECYGRLAEKTFKSIQYLTKNFNFKTLHKGDDTKKIPENYCFETEMDYGGFSNWNHTRDATKKMKIHPRWIVDGDRFVAKGLRQTSAKSFQKWARKKFMKIDSWFLDRHVWYSSWKPYFMSRRFCELIAEGGEGYADIYIEKLGGCEDHMIGKIFKDLAIYARLKHE